jgi:thioesterase domain-containing protein
MERLIKTDILPQDIDFAQFEDIWQLYRANHFALARYEPQEYNGRITLFMAAVADTKEGRAPIKSWGPLAKGGLNIDVLPGNHYAMLSHPVVRLTADKLQAFLESARLQWQRDGSKRTVFQSIATGA